VGRQKRMIDIRFWIADNLSRCVRPVMHYPTAHSDVETAFQLTAVYGLSKKPICLSHAALATSSNQNDF
jgi:hypothetical protein